MKSVTYLLDEYSDLTSQKIRPIVAPHVKYKRTGPFLGETSGPVFHYAWKATLRRWPEVLLAICVIGLAYLAWQRWL
jgi:hypothetical protein